ncbi:MAG: OmpA family protein [Mariprofundales bacterium]|nr:OmpA family protein [Mariprofundales bacterium]
MRAIRITPPFLAACAAALLSACVAAPLNTEISPLNDARTWIAKAKAAGAEQCAPALQAEAVGQLYAAAHEYAEGNVHPDEQTETAAAATTAAKKAYAKCTNHPQVMRLTGVYFDTNSAHLKSASEATLNHAIKVLKANKKSDVEIAAYTDSRGSSSYNLKLSKMRADAVRDYLRNHNIAANRLTAKGYGESHPIASNASAAGRSKNRRVELHLK